MSQLWKLVLLFVLLFSLCLSQESSEASKSRKRKRGEIIEEKIVKTLDEALEVDPFLWVRSGGSKLINEHFQCQDRNCPARKSISFRSDHIILRYRNEHLETCQPKKRALLSQEEVRQAKERNTPPRTLFKNAILRRMKENEDLERIGMDPHSPALRSFLETDQRNVSESSNPLCSRSLNSLRSIYDLNYDREKGSRLVDEISRVMRAGKGFVRFYNVMENESFEIFMIADQAMKILKGNQYRCFHLDGTHSVIDPRELGEGYQLITLLARTDKDIPLPLAHMVTNGRDAKTYSRFLKHILEFTDDLWG